MTHVEQSDYVNEAAVAARLAVRVSTVRAWRFRGHGPRWLKIGRAVRYSLRELDAWLAGRPTGGDPLETR